MNKTKNDYTTMKNIKFILHNLWNWDKRMLVFSTLQIPIAVLLPLLATVMSSIVVRFVSEGKSITELLLSILLLSAVMLFLYLSRNILIARIDWKAFSNRFKYMILCAQKQMDTDFENISSYDGQSKSMKARGAISSNESGTQQIIPILVEFITNILGIFIYSAIVITLNPFVLLVLIITTLADYGISLSYNKWHHKNKDNWVVSDRKLFYINSKAGDFSSAKDIRLFNMVGWFKEKYDVSLKERVEWQDKILRRTIARDIATVILTFIRDGLALGYLLYSVIYLSMDASSFVLFFGLITQFSNWILGLFSSASRLNLASLSIADLRQYLDMTDKLNRDEGLPIPKETCSLRFENVSFAYPDSSVDIIHDLSFTIKEGEKVAVVGTNGSGKSTLVKLLSGLYTPREGTIYANNRDIRLFNIKEYYSLLSAVYQNIHILPVSIAKNISLSIEEKTDESRLYDSLKMADFYDKVMSYSNKENQLLLKSVVDDAVELSGGEVQKLALARALYKQGAIIILDEPTAALDPIAEDFIYQQYNNLTKGRTSLFISHRLSSTKFCDTILLLENGKIIERGTHDELLNLGGKYFEMFKIQSQYYEVNKQ